MDFGESFSRSLKGHRKLNVNLYIDDEKNEGALNALIVKLLCMFLERGVERLFHVPSPSLDQWEPDFKTRKERRK